MITLPSLNKPRLFFLSASTYYIKIYTLNITGSFHEDYIFERIASVSAKGRAGIIFIFLISNKPVPNKKPKRIRYADTSDRG